MCDFRDKCRGVKTYARLKYLITKSNWQIQATKWFFKHLNPQALRVIPNLPHIPRGIKQVRSYLTNVCKENKCRTGVMENLSRESHSITLVFNRGSCVQLFHQLWPSRRLCPLLCSVLWDTVLRTSCVPSISFLMGHIPGNTGLSSGSHDW